MARKTNERIQMSTSLPFCSFHSLALQPRSGGLWYQPTNGNIQRSKGTVHVDIFYRTDLFAGNLNLPRLNTIVNDLLRDKGTHKLYLKQQTDIARLNRCNFNMADKIEKTGKTERVLKTGRSPWRRGR